MHGSILSPLLYNIFMCDMFLILKTTRFNGYTDDNVIPYNLRRRSQFQISLARTVFSGRGTIKFLGPRIWQLVPFEIKELQSPW